MKLKLLLAVISVFLVVACTQIQEEDVAKTEDQCSGIVCNENQQCVNATCICNEGFKECEEKCISKESCCSNEECNENELCKNNECILSQETILCPYYQTYDEDEKKCVCTEGTIWCNYQKKCIKTDRCCDNYDCEGSKKCIITTRSVYICLEGEEKTCKYVGENSFVNIYMYGNRYKFALEKIYANNEMEYSMDDGPLQRLKLGDVTKLAQRLYLRFLEIKETGGTCKY